MLCNKMDVENSKGPPLLHFLALGYCQYFQCYPNFSRYVRTTLRFTKQEADVQTNRSYLPQQAIPERLKRFRE